MNMLKKIIAGTTMGVLALGFAMSAPASAASFRLTAPIADWTGGAVTCKILQIILEDEMGFEVQRVNMPGSDVLESMSKGDLDFACEGWPSYEPTKAKYIKEFGGDGSVVKLGDAGIVGMTSYYVPRYMVEGVGAPAADLKTIADLNNYVYLFKTPESGDRGRLLGCPTSAWECEDQARLDGLGINFKAVEVGSIDYHWLEMQAAFRRKENFVAYAYEPHWIHASLDLAALVLPDFDDALWPATGWAKDITYNYGRPGMLTEHPEAAALITNMNLSNAAQAAMILAIDVDGRNIDDVVKSWMAANEDTWRAWMD